MSKLGKKPIKILKDITVNIDKDRLTFKGPKGTQEIKVNNRIFSTEISDDNYLSIRPLNKTDMVKKDWGMLRSIISNKLHGVNFGYEKTLEMNGVGYRASVKGNYLNLQLGFSHDINYEIPKDIKLSVEKQTIIKISGIDKELIGKVASEIKSYKPTEPYKGKGIKEKGQYVLRKEGKKK